MNNDDCDGDGAAVATATAAAEKQFRQGIMYQTRRRAAPDFFIASDSAGRPNPDAVDFRSAANSTDAAPIWLPLSDLASRRPPNTPTPAVLVCSCSFRGGTVIEPQTAQKPAPLHIRVRILMQIYKHMYIHALIVLIICITIDIDIRDNVNYYY